MVKKTWTSSSQKMAKWALTYEGYASTLVIRKMEIKATMRHQYPAMGMAKKKTRIYGDNDNMGHLPLLHASDKHLN